MIFDLRPDLYAKDIFEVHYKLLRASGIKNAIFDIDGTILPFDDINVTDRHITLFDFLKNDLGFNTCLLSSGSEKRVKPVSSALGVRYMAGVCKPLAKFSLVRDMFGDECKPTQTMIVGDSFLLDMIFAKRCGIYKVMVDQVRDDFNIHEAVHNAINYPLSKVAESYGFEPGNYYHDAKRL